MIAQISARVFFLQYKPLFIIFLVVLVAGAPLTMLGILIYNKRRGLLYTPKHMLRYVSCSFANFNV